MKIALITGGSRGLGKSAALALAHKGVDVILTYNSQKADADKVVAEIQKLGRKAVALQLDVSKSDGFAHFVAEVKMALQKTWNASKFQILVNNAGTGLRSSFMETTEAQFDDLFKIHFKAPYFLTQKLVPIMEDGGRIINISSGLARFSMPGSSAYGSMKAGVEALTRYMAIELGPRKITVNVVAPGPIETDFNGGLVRDNKDLNKILASQTALGRVGLPDDVGLLIANMASDDTRWVTGQRIEVSGGIHL